MEVAEAFAIAVCASLATSGIKALAQYANHRIHDYHDAHAHAHPRKHIEPKL